MKQFLLQVLKYLSFWLLFLFMQRVSFLAYNSNMLSAVEWSTLLESNWIALRFDFATAGYLIIIPFALLIIHGFRELPWLCRTLQLYTLFFTILSGLIFITDLGLYSSWGTKINAKALSYIAYPDEVFASAMSVPYFKLLLLCGLQVLLGIFMYKKLFKNIPSYTLSRLPVLVTFTLFLPLLVIGIRGGLTRKPVSKGWAYYSRYPVANNAAINSPWNLLYTFTHPVSVSSNPYNYLQKDTAEKVVNTLYAPSSGNTPAVLTGNRPNIVVIMLESWSADVIKDLGGEPNVTPAFNDLCKEGLLFTNFYASGNRTEQGLIALLSGFPAQPTTSIVRDFGKFEKLPSVISSIDSLHYYSAAYYGSHLYFANTGSYLNWCGFKKVLGEDDIPYSGRTIWGIHDEHTFNYQVQDLGNLPQPFFSLLMSITSHEPFDAPGPVAFKGESMEQKYRNAVHYTDNCLKNYFAQARKQPWYNNTLFILLSDHSHIYPRLRSDDEPARYHIPLLMCGGALKNEWKGKTIDTYGSQTDVASTLLHQLGISSRSFRWSKDLLDPASSSFSFYTYEDGFGWVGDQQYIVYDNTARKLNRKQYSDTSGIQKGKAYLQTLFQEYLKY